MPTGSPRLRRLALDAIFAGKTFDEKSLRSPQWLKDSRRYSYVDNWPGTETATVWVHDTGTGERKALFDPALLTCEGLEKQLTLHAVTWSPDETRLLMTSDAPTRFKPCGDLFLFDVGGGALTRLTESAAPQYHPAFSPGGDRVGFVRDSDLWVVDCATGSATRLTHDGGEALYNGRAGWVYEEELYVGRAWEWSPDGARIAFLQQDEALVPEVWISQYDKPHADPRKTRYPKAGDPNPTTRVGIAEPGGMPTWVTLGTGLDDGEHYIAHIMWAPAGEGLLIQAMPRLQNRLVLLLADPATGACRPLIDEADEAWVDHPGKLTFVEGSDSFIWPSDRDGNRRLYLHSISRGAIGPITPAREEAMALVSLDSARREVWYQSASPNPCERRVRRVPLEGGNPVTVDDRRGTHSTQVAPDGSRWIATHSDANTPATISLCRRDVAEAEVLVSCGSPDLARYQLAKWEMVSFTTADGQVLNGRLLKPHRMVEGKRYPVLMYTYGGPGSQVVMDSWGGKGGLWYQMLAGMGYGVFMADNRGTGARGRAFMKQTYLRLGHWEVNDQCEAARWLGTLPWVDAGRIGIWGWSYGGYMAANCILQGADLFRAAISVAPVTDWALYDTIYTERYMRRPCENEEGYRDGSPVTHAAKLTGRYLLLHGTMDDNVHFQNAARLASALQDADKPFETMFYPGKHHGIEDRHHHLYGVMTRFLKANL